MPTIQKYADTFLKVKKLYNEVSTAFKQMETGNQLDKYKFTKLKKDVRILIDLMDKVDVDEIQRITNNDEFVNKLKADLSLFKGTAETIQNKIADNSNIKKEDPHKTKIESIKTTYNLLKKEVNTMDIDVAINDTKRLEREIDKLNFAELPEGDYDDMLEIKNDISKIIKTFQGVQKSEKYGPYLESPMYDLILHNITNGSKDAAKTRTATILDFIEKPERIDIFEPPIKRIIAKKMTPKEFKQFYQSIITMKEGNREFESFDSYKKYYEPFYLV
jgi:hypothetical protein